MKRFPVVSFSVIIADYTISSQKSEILNAKADQQDHSALEGWLYMQRACLATIFF
jgi:hypothetical protein